MWVRTHENDYVNLDNIVEMYVTVGSRASGTWYIEALTVAGGETVIGTYKTKTEARKDLNRLMESWRECGDTVVREI